MFNDRTKKPQRRCWGDLIQMCAYRLLANAFYVQLHINVSRWTHGGNTKVFQFKAGVTHKTGTVVAPWIFTMADEFSVDFNRLGLTMQGEITRNGHRAVAVIGYIGAFK